jgi:mannitol/fructose-specific phosphotransferase system IIA component (Ntr-type)
LKNTPEKVLWFLLFGGINMVISDLVYLDLVDVHLKSVTKEAAISEIVDFLSEKNKIGNKQAVLQALLDREKHGTTGIGNGVAVPHARLEHLSEVILFVGTSRKGIDFSSVDGKPVRIILFLLAPVSDIGTSLKILANIARMINDRYFTKQLLQASSNEELYHILKQSSHDKETSFALKDQA